MSDIAIQVENIGKRYVLGPQSGGRSKYRTLRESLVSGVQEPFRALLRSVGASRSEPKKNEEFWAVEDVSFDVRQGEVIGIIGRNGAGKSTLLKVLSRITEPTRGRLSLQGRVASLLEVGTGFHPELTGRENIFLNGAILGMARTEIRARFDEIVAFAETEKFLDLPVKRYSSGMYMRLAFAVAAHLEPEILIVDEVLAVGDSDFQKKCLNKMQDVGKGGRTVLFVSHSMPAITRLCPRTIMLHQGRVVRDGPTHDVVGEYMGSGLGLRATREWPDAAAAPGNEITRLRAVRVLTAEGLIAESMDIRHPIGVEIEFDVLQAEHVLVPNFVFTNEEGICVFHPHDWAPDWRGKSRPLGRHKRTAWIPGNLLPEGTFFVGVAVSSYNPTSAHFYERDVVAFQVFDSLEGDTARGDYGGILPGVVRPLLEWSDNPSHPVAVPVFT